MTERSFPADTVNRSAGLLIVGHGTRDEIGREEFLETARLVERQAPGLAIEPGFLELCSPRIDEALGSLVRRGARCVVAAPLMLFAAGHVKRDIPAAIAAAAPPGIEVKIASHLGCRPLLVELSQQRMLQAVSAATARIDDAASVSPGKRLLLLVGRGSRDSSATREMLQFAELRRQTAGGFDVETAFLAMAEPALDDVLPRLEQSACKQIVVQPHLLFQGELLARLNRQVAEIQSRRRSQQWIVTRHLGPHPLLAQAILEISGLRRQENLAALEAPIGRNK